MAAIHLEPPEKFNFKCPDEWPRCKRRFEQFSIASGLAAEATVKQVSNLFYCMGEEAEEVLLSTRITEAERKVYATVLEKKSWTRTSKFGRTLFLNAPVSTEGNSKTENLLSNTLWSCLNW